MTPSDQALRRELPFSGLVAFEATARHGSVSRAADELNLTQSAVSQRLLKLEAFLGQQLFMRVGHGVRITAAGELLLETTRDTLQRLRKGLERIEPYRNKASLLLACPVALVHGWLTPRLGALKRLHPAMEVWLLGEQDLTAIDRVDVDLIISSRPLHTPDVECVPFLEDQAIAVCGPQTGRALAGQPFPGVLEKAPLLLLEREQDWGGLLATPPHAPRIRRAVTSPDERVVLDAVEQELGIAYLSRLLVAGSLAAGRTVQLEQVPATARPHVWLMRSRLAPRTPLANQAFEWLLAQVPGGRPA